MSPRMHNAAFAYDGADYAYAAMDVRPDYLPAAVGGLRALGFAGFNVTMPHKEAVLPLMDELDDAARISGAVNTVVVDDGDGRRTLHGLNTDGSGFVEACAEVGLSLRGRRVLILGAGGAAAAIAAAALMEDASQLCIANRTPMRAEELARRLSGAELLAGYGGVERVRVVPLEEVGGAAAEAEVIVNATYLGMKKEDPLPLPEQYVTAEKAVCDAVYLRGGETALVRRAREVGARAVVAGGRMLLYQGVQAQRAWTGREPNVGVMSDALS